MPTERMRSRWSSTADKRKRAILLNQTLHIFIPYQVAVTLALSFRGRTPAEFPGRDTVVARRKGVDVTELFTFQSEQMEIGVEAEVAVHIDRPLVHVDYIRAAGSFNAVSRNPRHSNRLRYS